MKPRKIGALICALAILAVIGYAIFKVITGKELGFEEVAVIGVLFMTLFSTMTWGDKEEKDGIFIGDELGKKITEKSSKISYYILLVFILLAVGADKLLSGTINVFLLALLGLAMILLPLIEFIIAKQYES